MHLAWELEQESCQLKVGLVGAVDGDRKPASER